MTTIVCDGEIIASDSRRNVGAGGIAPFAATPKFWVRDRVIFALSGCVIWGPAFEAWYFKETKNYPRSRDEAEIVVLDGRKGNPRGWRTYYSDTEYPQHEPVQWVSGSGEPYALAALLCGKNAPEAVAIAIQLDNSSGGRIFSARICDLLSKGNDAISEFVG